MIAPQLASGAATAVDAPVKPFALGYRDGNLSWPGGSTRAAAGEGGVRAAKQEGDGATPAGIFPLLGVFYRPDRLARPMTGLPASPIGKADGWVDDPDDPQYNRRVTLPYPARCERLWRRDGIYDLLVVIGYNTDPVVPGRGSAIFLHVARADFSPTLGCIAIERRELLRLVARLGPGSTISIQR